MNATPATPGISRLVGPHGEPLPSFLLPHAQQFASVWNLPSKSYRWTYDEALKRSETDALSMRRDLFIMKCLRARQRPVAKAKWHLEPENPDDPGQKQVAERMTKIIKVTPHLMKFRMCLQEAVWFGRYGNQVARRRHPVGGQMAWSVHDWRPVNGDKITFRWDGTPGVRVNAAYASELKDQGACVELTDKSSVLFLDNPGWRSRFCIHKHEIEDADYQESELAGGVHGVGIRHYVYWAWWLRQEIMAWLLDYLELMGAGGLTVVGYPVGNTVAQAAAEREFAARKNIVFIPMPMGADKEATVVKRIEPSGTGNSILREMVDGYFNANIKEFVLGQNLSSESAPTGLGSGVANFQANTLQDILEYDAENVEETLTTDFVMPLTRLNYPRYPHMLYWRNEIHQPDVEKAMQAAKSLNDMGVDLDADEVRGLSGLAKPKPGAALLKGKSQAAMPGMPGGPGMPLPDGAGGMGGPGGAPTPEGQPGQPGGERAHQGTGENLAGRGKG